MAATPETGFLVLADLTGYTAYLLENGTHLRLRWAYEGGTAADAAAVQRMRGEKEAAYARLATVVAGALPVVQQKEARP